MRQSLWLLAVLPVAIDFQAATAWASDEEADRTAGAARAVLRRHCWRCHSGEGSEAGGFDVLRLDDLTESGYVVAGDVASSYLFERIADDEMPPRGIPLRPTAAEGEAVRRWIAAGLPPFPKAEARPFVQLAAVLKAIRDHLRKAGNNDRPHLRYFTMHNLANNPRVLEEDLPLYQAALSKALNSLHRRPRIVLPQAIDQAGTLFVIDLRDLGWDRGDRWHELLRAYPYGLTYGNHPDPGLKKLQEELADLSACDLPYVRADWFVATATRPPLYHALLELPATARELEAELGVEGIAENFLRPKPALIARGGFSKSGVSGQNRMVERHESRDGAYWKSYDFKPGNARSKLTRFPLGPLDLFEDGKHPFPLQAFVHDGGELIFHLPNGLQGYMLIDAKGERIDDGPIDVVSDALKTSGTPVIVNGVSCMACHKHGMIDFADTLREGSAVFGEAEDLVQRLFPEPEFMGRLVESDRRRFLSALEEAIGPFLRIGENNGRPITDFPEPVGEVARLHRLVFLDLKTIACELDIADPQEIVRKVGEKRLKQLGLEALVEDRGVVGRLEWEAVGSVSLMQELARELRATPLRVR
jgi:serine/threonine-protein kinase